MRNSDIGLAQALLPIITNLAIVPALIWTIRKHIVVLSVVNASVLIWSTLFHLCDGFESLCVAKFSYLMILDHYFATYMFVALAVFLMSIKSKGIQTFLYVLFAKVLALAILFEGAGTYVLAIVIIAALCILLLKWCCCGFEHLDWSSFALGIILSLLGLVLFLFFDANQGDYWLYHSFWHMLDMGAEYFVLCAKERRLSCFGLIPHRNESPYEGEKEKKNNNNKKKDDLEKQHTHSSLPSLHSSHSTTKGYNSSSLSSSVTPTLQPIPNNYTTPFNPNLSNNGYLPQHFPSAPASNSYSAKSSIYYSPTKPFQSKDEYNILAPRNQLLT